MPRRGEPDECLAHGCRNAARYFCRAHFYALPEDLRERLKWAVRDGDTEDIDSAIHAALDAS